MTLQKLPFLFRSLLILSLTIFAVAIPVAVGQEQPASPAPVQSKIEPEKSVVVVTGTLEPAPLEEVDRSVGVIEVHDVAPLHHYWTEVLQSDSSLDLRQRGGNGVQGDLSVRGSTFGQTLILLDGLRLNDAQTAHHNLDVPVPLDALDRVEVLRGAGSSLYGADAIGGAVNFITLPPKFSELRFGAEVGNFGVNAQSLNAGFVRQGWSEQLNLWRDFSSGFRPDRNYRNSAAFSNTNFTTALGNTSILLGISDKPFGADQFYCACNSFERTKAWFTGLKQNLGKDTELDFGYRRHTDEFILLRNNPSYYENNHISESYQIALRRKQTLGTNAALFFGGEGFRDFIDSNNLGRHSRNRGAGYADLDVRALGRVSFSLGAREEVYESTSEFTPSIAAGVALKAGWKLKASVSRGFRIPTYTDLYYNDPATQGNANLKPESAWNYEGGVVWNPGGRWQGDATVFHSRQKNVIDYVLDTGGKYVAANLDRVNYTGGEASLRMRLPRDQQVAVSYTVVHGAIDSAQSQQQSRYTSNYPTHRAVLSWSGTLPGKIQARSQLGVVQRVQVSAQDPYALWDAALSREFYGRVRANVQFSNISNTDYTEIPKVVMPGRSVVFGLDFVLWRKGR